MSSQIEILTSELDDDPLGRGYASMSDEDAAGDLNTVYRTRNISNLTPSEFFQVVEPNELNALSAEESAVIWNILHLAGDINPMGREAEIFFSVFGAQSQTIANLSVIRETNISRAEEIGIAGVRPGHVQQARAI